MVRMLRGRTLYVCLVWMDKGSQSMDLGRGSPYIGWLDRDNAMLFNDYLWIVSVAWHWARWQVLDCVWVSGWCDFVVVVDLI